MTSVMNPYEALYTNLKNNFTVIHNGAECTVGDFMLMQASKRAESSLPIATTYTRTASLQSIVEYVNDKLTVKRAPIKDRTIRTFPLRTSFSSLLSATAACALILSCGIFAAIGNNATLPYTAKAENTHMTETAPTDTNADIEVEYEVSKTEK